MSLPTEFDRTGVTYYAIAPDGYVYSSEQTAQYGTRKYTTMAACAAAMPYSPSTPFVVNIIGSWTTALATSTWSGPTFTATNWLIIRCIGEARHNGVYSSTAARVSVTSGYGLQIYTAYTTVEGLQFVAGTPTADIYMVGIYSSSSCALDSCLIKGPGGTPSNYMWGIEGGGAGAVIKNCVIYDWTSSIGGGVGIAPEYSANHYNNTIRNCDYGFYSYASGGVATNNVVQDCSSGCYYGTSSFTGSNNVSDDATAPGTSAINGEVAFEGETAGNFQLTSGDTVARGRGVTLAAVDDDVTGTARNSPPSCGAFEGTSGGGSNDVSEPEQPASPVSSQSVTQPTEIASSESPTVSSETSTAGQENAVESSESPAASSELSVALIGNTVTGSESPQVAVEFSAIEQPSSVISTEEPVGSIEAGSITPGVVVASLERVAAPGETETVTQQTTVLSLESPESPVELSSATQPVVIVSSEAPSSANEAASATQGTAVLSVETSQSPTTTQDISQPVDVSSVESPSLPLEHSTATETWSVSSSEAAPRSSELQSVEQTWAATSTEIPSKPTESETLGWAYLVGSNELAGAVELEAAQQPFAVVSVETPNGAVEISRVYGSSVVTGGSVTIVRVAIGSVAFEKSVCGSIAISRVPFGTIDISRAP